VFAKSSGIAFAEFLWVQQFSTEIAFRIGAEILNQRIVLAFFFVIVKNSCFMC
jgi:hypothetical protein